MTALLGVQTQSAARADAGIRRIYPAIWKLIGRPAINILLLEDWRAHQPNGTLIYREPFEDEDLTDVEGRCARLIESVAPIRHVIDYVEVPWNEVAGAGGPALDLYCALTVRAVEILAAAGLRAIVGNFAEGNPGDLTQWVRFVPALRAARLHGGALGLHEYSAPTMQTGEGWHCLRFEQVYNLLPVDCRIDLIITEAGLDWTGRAPAVDGWGSKGFGWRAHGVEASDYAAQIRWYVEGCQGIVASGLVPSVRVVLFGLGLNPDWASFDVDGATEVEDVIREYSVVDSTAVVIDRPVQVVTPPSGGNGGGNNVDTTDLRFALWQIGTKQSGGKVLDIAGFAQHIEDTGGNPGDLAQYGCPVAVKDAPVDVVAIDAFATAIKAKVADFLPAQD